MIFFLIISTFFPLLPALLPQVKKKALYVTLIGFLIYKDIFTVFLPIYFSDLWFDEILSPMFLMQGLYFMIFGIILLYFTFLYKAPIIFMRPYRVNNNLLVLLGLLSFLVLIVNSDGIWLKNPRLGYQNFRSGVGFFWALYISSISLLVAHYYSRKEIRFLTVLVLTLFFFYSGSKYLTLVSLISYFFFKIFKNEKIKISSVVIISLVVIVLFLIQFDQFSSNQEFIERFSTYMDFVKNARLVYMDYNLGYLEFKKGLIFITSFWEYVPRGIFPDKPWVYGSLIVLEDYYPGLAKTGHTPSFGFLTAEFVDFGYLGSILYFLKSPIMVLKMWAVVWLTNRLDDSKNVVSKTLGMVPSFGFHLPFLLQMLLLFLSLKKWRKF